uniref:Ig-like domain-containing protein n=1 Tax=Stegastes partitus TaxID=144197 RepID=A0A3B4ZF03_9TELE
KKTYPTYTIQEFSDNLRISSPASVVALAGEDVLLPCRLQPPISDSSITVEWTRPGLDPGYIHDHQVYHSQNPGYQYRTALFVDQLINGNVSLKLFRVKMSDAGKYRCFLPSLQMESFVHLSVGSASSPEISLAGLDRSSSSVVLQCESAGWYPEPELLWLDGEGKFLSAGPPETVRGPDDLYTVSSRVTVEKRHSNTFTCRVQQNNINQTRETRIHVPGLVFLGLKASPSLLQTWFCSLWPNRSVFCFTSCVFWVMCNLFNIKCDCVHLNS